MKQRITSNWFEVKVRVKNTLENGLEKYVTESHAVDALSWGEAEQRITTEMSACYKEHEITDIWKAVYKDVIMDDDAISTGAKKWYKCKVAFITQNDNGKEKRSNVYYLVCAVNIDKAKRTLDESMTGTLVDYEVASVVETKIENVYLYSSRETGVRISIEAVEKNKPS